MSLRKLFVTSALAVLVSTLAPGRASADWLFTPFVGATFNGSANFGAAGVDVKTDLERNLTYGASFGWMGNGVIGFEVDLGYSPNFFDTNAELDNGFDLIGDGNVTTLMANLLVGAPLGGVRPYASGGVGLIRTSVDGLGQFFDQLNESDLGLNAGAGIMGFFGDNIGIRGDIRYFRSISDTDLGDLNLTLGDFDFWRGTVGVTFRF
jgi:hypothetical protein